jgi:hypothetical protein
MTQQHPITPPPELVQQWFQEWNCDSIEEEDSDIYVATRAAQWGADQELEACCEWFVRDWTDVETADALRAARRPKPKSLKEEAITALGPEPLPETDLTGDTILNKERIERHRIVRRALEQLDD